MKEYVDGSFRSGKHDARKGDHMKKICMIAIVGLLLTVSILSVGAQMPAVPGSITLKTPPTKPASIAYLANKFSILEYYANAMKKVEEVPANNIKFQVDWLPTNERTQKAILVLSSSDTSYEIIHATTSNMVDWADRGWLMPLDDLIAKYKEQYKLGDIPESVWAKMRVKGKTYAIPNSGNAQIFFYRKDIWAKYGLTPPKTWAEAETQFKLLAEKKDTPSVFAGT